MSVVGGIMIHARLHGSILYLALRLAIVGLLLAENQAKVGQTDHNPTNDPVKSKTEIQPGLSFLILKMRVDNPI